MFRPSFWQANHCPAVPPHIQLNTNRCRIQPKLKLTKQSLLEQQYTNQQTTATGHLREQCRDALFPKTPGFKAIHNTHYSRAHTRRARRHHHPGELASAYSSVRLKACATGLPMMQPETQVAGSIPRVATRLGHEQHTCPVVGQSMPCLCHGLQTVFMSDTENSNACLYTITGALARTLLQCTSRTGLETKRWYAQLPHGSHWTGSPFSRAHSTCTHLTRLGIQIRPLVHWDFAHRSAVPAATSI